MEMTITQAAAVLSVSSRTVRKYLAEGSLPCRNAAPLASSKKLRRIPRNAVLEMRGKYACLAPESPAGFDTSHLI